MIDSNVFCNLSALFCPRNDSKKNHYYTFLLKKIVFIKKKCIFAPLLRIVILTSGDTK